MTSLKIIQIKQEFSSIWSFIFEKPEGFFYYPGQYIDIRLDKTRDPYPTRAFTLSSSPTEDFLMITTRIGQSEYKKTLKTLKLGDSVTISHPAGTFSYDPTEPGIFVARGIGITPFRSILKYLSDTKQAHKSIRLHYIDPSNKYVFKEEVEKWQIATPLASLTPRDDTVYYLSGPPKFVKEVYKKLTDQGVEELNIRTDEFDGY